jgi:hypothetical protein
VIDVAAVAVQEIQPIVTQPCHPPVAGPCLTLIPSAAESINCAVC